MSSRAAATRQGLLDAAAEAFSALGYHDAAVADIVEQAGASVGSLYHHFGGKADLYTALFEEYQERHEERTTAAVAAARRSGTTDPAELFGAGARAYLLGCWDERVMCRLFHAGDGPAGFLVIMRANRRRWIHQNAALLRTSGDAFDEALVSVLTTVLWEAGHEVAVQEDEKAAIALADDVVVLISRMTAA